MRFQSDKPHNENDAKHLLFALNDGYKSAEQSTKPMGKQEFKKENILNLIGRNVTYCHPS